MRVVTGLLVVLPCLFMAAAAPAQTTDWRPPAIGTTFEWRINGADTVIARVVAVSGFLVTEEANPGGRRSRYFDFMVPETATGEAVRIDPAQLKYFWPLEIGKTAHFEFGSGASTSIGTLTVSGYEHENAVPAGVFETFIIDWDERGAVEGRFRVHTRVWFAPALGTYVRFEREITAGPETGQRTSGALVSVRPPP